jgi:hypothetical protein
MELNLFDTIKNKEWFDSVTICKDKVIVYTKFMNSEVFSSVPDSHEGKRILLNFAASKNLTKENFIETIVLTKEIELDKDKLIFNLKNLSNEFGANLVETIFYEIHDGDNRITNLSEKYPFLKEKLQNLYDEYGFDIIYGEFQ